MTKYVVTVVDYGDSCDGKARVLFLSDKKDDAKKFVIEDMKCWCENYNGLDYECNFDDMSTSYGENRSEWNIEEIKI